MSSWDRFSRLSTFITLEEFTQLSAQGDATYESPVLKLVAETQSKGYDLICLPLTTDRWKKRWRDMCILPSESDRDRDVHAETRAEAWRAGPAFLRDEVTMTRLGKLSTSLIYPEMFLADQAVVDEAEGVTAMVSDWLELDAADDWVRHDSEIVCPLSFNCFPAFPPRSAIIFVIVLALEKKWKYIDVYI
jgi:protein arginine N-methyltransferase 5